MSKPKFSLGDLVYHKHDKERQIPGIVLEYIVQSTPSGNPPFYHIQWMKQLPWEAIWSGPTHDGGLGGYYSTGLLISATEATNSK